MSNDSSQQPFNGVSLMGLRQVIQWLTRPHPSITDIETRRQSQLLAGIILAIIVSTFAGLVVLLLPFFKGGQYPDSIKFLIPAQILITILYFVNRMGYYRLSANLVVIVHFTTTHLAVLPTNEIAWLFYASSAIILSAILLSFRTTVVLFILSLGIQLFFNTAHPMSIPVSNVVPLVVFLMTAWLVLVFFNHRVGLEKERQLELRTAIDALQASEAVLEQRVEERTRELEKARQDAEQANEVKSQFLANMSHELRTPLNAILNFTAFVSDGVMGPVNDEQVDALQQSISSGKHLLALINDVLDITKIETGMMDIFIQKVDINEAVEAVVSMSKGLLKGKPIQLQTDIEAQLPVTYGDKRRLRQVFLNVVSNAVKFTQEGSVTIRVTHTDQHVLFVVKDTGIGIAPENHALVFQSFKQAKHELLDTPGTGLGMPISKFFVEAHGGRMWFESALGMGTTFFVELPLSTEEQAYQLITDQNPQVSNN